MPRHKTYVPHGVIPAVILPFHDDLSIDEANFRKHLRDVTVGRGAVGRHHQRAFHRGRVLHLRRAEARARHRRQRDRRQDAAHQRHLGRRQPRGGAPRQDGDRGRRLGAAGVSAGAVHDGPERRDGDRAFQAHRRRHRPAADRVPVSAGDRPGLSERDHPADDRGHPDAEGDQGLGRHARSSTNGTSARCRTCRGRSTCCRRRARG